MNSRASCSYQVFSSTSLTSLNVSGWRVSQVTNMHHLFAYTNLSTLDLSTWDFDSVRSGDFENFVAGGIKWNVDINASLNIMRKVVGDSIYKNRKLIEGSAGIPLKLTV